MIADGSRADSTPNTARPGEMPVVPPVPVAQMFRADDTVLAGADQSEQDAHRREEAALSTPAAREERAQSQDEFADLSDSQAVALARSTFDELLTGPSEEVPTLDNGVRIVDYRDQNTAVLQTATGEPFGLLEATTPMTTDASADEAISLDLIADGDGFAPENPRVDVELPSSAEEPTTLPEAGISFAPVGAENVEAERRSDRLIYPSIDTDTDYIVQPTELGAESFWQLRSADSPDTLRLRYSLPPGATLEDRSLTGQGIAAAIVLDGQTIGAIRPVSATDATDRSIEVTSEVDGNDLVIHADINDSSVQFPVLVDPRTESWYGSQTNGCGWGSASGIWNQEQLGPRSFGLACGEGSFFGLTGFYIGAPTYNWYAAGDAFQINYWPRQNTYISKAVWTNFRHGNVYGTYGYTGLYCDYCRQWLQINDDFWGNGGQTIEHNAEALSGDRAVMGLRFHTQVQSQGAYQGVEGVYLEIKDGQDPDPPIITNNSPAPVSTINGEKYYGWNVNPSFSASGLDIGFGTWNVAVLKDDGSAIWGPYWFDKNGNETSNSAAICTGTVANPCKTYANVGSAMHPFANLAEGDNSGRVVTTDAGGRYRYGTRVHILKDTQGPVLSAAGEAWDSRGTGYAHSVPLVVQASDAHNPVSDITVTIDGQVQPSGETDSSCSSGAPGSPCSMTIDSAIDAYMMQTGLHTIAITAQDSLGNQASPLTWTSSVLPLDGQDKTSWWDDGDAPTFYGSVQEDPGFEPRADGPAASLVAGGSGWGIADGKPNMFEDPEFQTLKANVRKIVPWDMMFRDPAWRAKRAAEGSPLPSPAWAKATGTDAAGAEKPYPGSNNPNGFGETLWTFDNWYRRAAGTSEENVGRIMVVLERTRTDPGQNYRPTNAQLSQAFQEFRRAYPKIKWIGPWNEPNNRVQPTRSDNNPSSQLTDRGGYVAGQYFKTIHNLCKAPPIGNTCRTIAGEFIDSETFDRARNGDYLDDYKQGMGATKDDAIIWGWHDYADAVGIWKSSRKATSTQPAHTKGQTRTRGGRLAAYRLSVKRLNPDGSLRRIWITESGGTAHYYRKAFTGSGCVKQPRLCKSEAEIQAQAQADTEWLLNNVPGTSDRIERFYNYQWYPDGPPQVQDSSTGNTIYPWDSALKNFDGSQRPDLFSYFNKACANFPANGCTTSRP